MLSQSTIKNKNNHAMTNPRDILTKIYLNAILFPSYATSQM